MQTWGGSQRSVWFLNSSEVVLPQLAQMIHSEMCSSRGVLSGTFPENWFLANLASVFHKLGKLRPQLPSYLPFVLGISLRCDEFVVNIF